MRILSRYFAARFLGLFGSILLGSLLVVVIVEMLLNLDQMMKVQEGAAGIAAYLALRVPSYYLVDLLPAVSYASGFLCLGLAARWHESTGIQTGGIPILRVMGPVLLAATLVAVLAFVLGETWVLEASREWKRRETGASQTLDYRRGSFWYQRGRMVYNIRGADRETRSLKGVRIYERSREGRLVRSIHAPRARIDAEGLWHFEDAVERSFGPLPGTSPPPRRSESLVMRLDVQDEQALMDADGSLLPAGVLLDAIRERRSREEDAHRLETVLHARVADPLSIVLLAWVAMPIGLRLERGRAVGATALGGIAVVGLFFLLRSTGRTLSNEGAVPALLPPLLLMALLVALGAGLSARAGR